MESTLTAVTEFWSADPRIEEAGKILIEIEHPLKRNVAASFFFFREENGRRVRILKVYGGYESPHQLAHKLTSALLPHPDILIRNMMGEVSEKRFGNPQSFPMCGFDNDDWVMALIQAGSYIPISKLGQEHSDWGKEIVDYEPQVKDRVKQHTCYLEAGSFGEFLIATSGVMKMKQFYRLSKNKSRPWEDVYKTSLEKLETRWLESLESRPPEKKENISVLLKLWKENPNTACFEAQDMTERK